LLVACAVCLILTGCGSKDPSALLPASADGNEFFASVDFTRLASDGTTDELMKWARVAEPNIDKVLERLGFDPKRDLKSALLAVGQPKEEYGDPDVTVIISGNFNADLLKNLAKELEEHVDIEIKQLNGYDCITIDDDAYLVRLDSRTLVFGTENMVSATIDVHSGKAKGLGGHPVLLDMKSVDGVVRFGLNIPSVADELSEEGVLEEFGISAEDIKSLALGASSDDRGNWKITGRMRVKDNDTARTIANDATARINELKESDDEEAAIARIIFNEFSVNARGSAVEFTIQPLGNLASFSALPMMWMMH